MGTGGQKGAFPTPPPLAEELYLNRLSCLGLSSLSFFWTRKILSSLWGKKKSFEWTLPSSLLCGYYTKTVTVRTSSSTVTGLDIRSGCKRIQRERKHKYNLHYKIFPYLWNGIGRTRCLHASQLKGELLICKMFFLPLTESSWAIVCSWNSFPGDITACNSAGLSIAGFSLPWCSRQVIVQ